MAGALGLVSPAFCFRPLLTNHHLYGAFRVGDAVSREFLFHRADNVYILPPTAYVEFDDDANPTLKSLILSQYAMDSVASRFSAAANRPKPLNNDALDRVLRDDAETTSQIRLNGVIPVRQD